MAAEILNPTWLSLDTGTSMYITFSSLHIIYGSSRVTWGFFSYKIISGTNRGFQPNHCPRVRGGDNQLECGEGYTLNRMKKRGEWTRVKWVLEERKVGSPPGEDGTSPGPATSHLLTPPRLPYIWTEVLLVRMGPVLVLHPLTFWLPSLT